MKKKIIIVVLIIITILIAIRVAAYYAFRGYDIWDINARELAKSLSKVKEGEIEDISPYIPFEWDTIYSFEAYTPVSIVYQIVGYKWDDIMENLSESMNQIVFLKDGKVVCFVDGYAEQTGVYFDFGEREKLCYLKYTNENKLPFKVIKKHYPFHIKRIPNFIYLGEDRVNIIAIRGEIVEVDKEAKTIKIEGPKQYDTRYEKVMVFYDPNTQGDYRDKQSIIEKIDRDILKKGSKVSVIMKDPFAVRSPDKDGYYVGEANIIYTIK